MYTAPAASMKYFILGISDESTLHKSVQRSITAENPASIPKLNGSAFLKPLLMPLVMDMMLLGPGVAAVITA